MEIKKITYIVRFVGPERYLVMKVLDREMRKSYNTFGGKLVKDTKDYSEVAYTIHEDPQMPFCDINSYVGEQSRNFCQSIDTDWSIVTFREHYCPVTVIH